MNNKKLAAVLTALAVIFVVGYIIGSASGKRHNTQDLPETATSPGISLQVVTESGTEPVTEEITEEITEEQPEEQTTKPAKTTSAKEKATKAAKTTKAPKSTKAPKTQKATEKPAEDTVTTAAESWTDWDDQAYLDYRFRSKKLLDQHWEKHGSEFTKDFGYANASEYEKGASDVINNPQALNKTEAEDGDYIYYIEDTNEFVVLSKDGYIRTYFRPNSGKKYYDRQ